MGEPEKEIEKKYSYNREQLVDFLENFKKEVEEGKINIENEQVQIPESNMEVEYGFKIEKGQSEIEIEIKWK